MMDNVTCIELFYHKPMKWLMIKFASIEFWDQQVGLSFGQIWCVDGLDFGGLSLKLLC